MGNRSVTQQEKLGQIDEELLSILVCPLTRSSLKQVDDKLISEVGGLRYSIRDGIPILLVEEAELPDGVASLDEFRKKYSQQIPD